MSRGLPEQRGQVRGYMHVAEYSLTQRTGRVLVTSHDLCFNLLNEQLLLCYSNRVVFCLKPCYLALFTAVGFADVYW